LELGAALARRKLASAMIDLSDGLSVDLAHVCEESGVGAEVEAARVPVSEALARFARDPLSLALNGGEDFELLFTVRPAHFPAVERLSSRFRLTRIGRITAGRRITLIGPGKKKAVLRPKGFEHFG
jgi:thiamine-monophosphate kinase